MSGNPTSGIMPGRSDRTGGESNARGRGPLAVWVMVGWTLFVWVNRIRNVMADPDLGGSARLGPILMSVALIVAALVVGFVAWSGRGPSLSSAVRVLAASTTVVWVVRSVDIVASGDHPVPFVVVHVSLAVVSIGVAVWALRACEDGSHILPFSA